MKNKKAQDPISSEQKITLTIAQAITVISIAIGTLGTFSYGIASYLHTKKIVEKLDQGNLEIQNDLSDLKQKVENLSDTIAINTLRLRHSIESIELKGRLTTEEKPAK